MLQIARMLKGIVRGAARGIPLTKSSALALQQTTQMWTKLSMPPIALSTTAVCKGMDDVTGLKGKSCSLGKAASDIFELGPPSGSLFSQGADRGSSFRQQQNPIKTG